MIEDAINKPWRAIPTGRISVRQTRWPLAASMPIVLAATWWLGVWIPTTLLVHLTWIYDQLGGGDEYFPVRHTLLWTAFALYNGGSLKLASGPEATLNTKAYQWILIISTVVATTIRPQDIKDQAGDGQKGRHTMPLMLGDSNVRKIIAVMAVLWSCFCPWFLGCGLNGYLVACTLGGIVGARFVHFREHRSDVISWKLWATWLIVIYSLPVFADARVFSSIGKA